MICMCFIEKLCSMLLVVRSRCLVRTMTKAPRHSWLSLPLAKWHVEQPHHRIQKMQLNCPVDPGPLLSL